MWVECERKVKSSDKQALYAGSYRAFGLCPDIGYILRT